MKMRRTRSTAPIVKTKTMSLSDVFLLEESLLRSTDQERCYSREIDRPIEGRTPCSFWGTLLPPRWVDSLFEIPHSRGAGSLLKVLYHSEFHQAYQRTWPLKRNGVLACASFMGKTTEGLQQQMHHYLSTVILLLGGELSCYFGIIDRI